MIVVDKPAGRGRAPGPRPPAAARSCRRSPGAWPAATTPSAPGVVHRLDRDTSGLLVARAHGGRARRAQGARSARRSHARVPRPGRGPPAARRARSTRRSAATGACARARLDGHRRAARGGHALRAPSARCRRATLLRVRLETGRTHQIRAHLQAIGHPVVGDPEYGGPGLLRPRAPVPARRAARLRAPVTGATVDLRSPLPEDLEAALGACGGATRERTAPPARKANRSTGGRGREGRPASTQTQPRAGTCLNCSHQLIRPRAATRSRPRPRPCPAPWRRVRAPRTPGCSTKTEREQPPWLR